jgi:outer membrane biogenesis lipoprotein LolB
MRRTLTLLYLMLLTGCGAEVAGTAATAAAAKAEEAKAAQRMQQEVVERYQQQMDAAFELERQRIEATERDR